MFTPLGATDAEQLVRDAPIPRRVGVVEYVLAGGTDPSSDVTALLLPEGRAMLAAAARGFAETPGVEQVYYGIHEALTPTMPRLERCSPQRCTSPEHAVRELTCYCDALLLIAPEIDGALAQLVTFAERLCSRNACVLLNLPADLCALFGDKVQTYRWLAQQEIPAVPHVPAKRACVGPPERLVAKPRYGAGCEGVQIVPAAETVPDDCCIAPFVPGLACSVSALLGPAHAVLLPPAYQWITVGDRFTYHGGAIPLPDPIAMPLHQLLYRLLLAMEPATGFIGIDCIVPWGVQIGSDSGRGPEALIVEVNPRMTTSVAAQPAAVGINIFGLLLALQHPCEAPSVSVLRTCRAVTFSPDGTVRSFL